jgi:hypothetical protein
MTDHEHEWERGIHMKEAFGVDGRMYACAICGIPRRPQSLLVHEVVAAHPEMSSGARKERTRILNEVLRLPYVIDLPWTQDGTPEPFVPISHVLAIIEPAVDVRWTREKP